MAHLCKLTFEQFSWTIKPNVSYVHIPSSPVPSQGCPFLEVHLLSLVQSSPSLTLETMYLGTKSSRYRTFNLALIDV